MELEPKHFAQGVKTQVEKQLKEQVEGQCSGRYGWTITVTTIQSISDGVLADNGKCCCCCCCCYCVCGAHPGRTWTLLGNAKFDVEYFSIVFRPFHNETLQAVVTSVNAVRSPPTHCWSSLCTLLTLHTLLTPLQQGFFAEAGPAQIFVHKLRMPEDLRFENTDKECYVSEDQEVCIQAGSLVRLQILNVKFAAKQIALLGNINKDYLGLIQME